MQIIVVNAPSGVALTSATDKIKAFLNHPPTGENAIPPTSVAMADVEDELLTLFRSDYPQQEPRSSGPMQDVLFKLPRDAVTQFYWPLAAKAAFKKLLTADAEICILRCHLTFYRGATREFYPVGDLEGALVNAARDIKQFEGGNKLNNSSPNPRIVTVLTLIDDIFDVFHRLSVEGQVFPLQSQIKSEYHQRQHEGRDCPSDPSSQYVLAFEQVITILHRLLEWRSREMTAGDVLASRSGAQHFVLGIKHPIETAVSLIRMGNGNSSLIPVYLSHPISRPRKSQKEHKTKKWGAFVNQFQGFVEAAMGVEAEGKRGIFFMPTAIDEFRFAAASANNFPSLERRWPLIHHAHGLLYDTPGGGDYDEFESNQLLEELFNPIGGYYDIESDVPRAFATTGQDVSKRLSDSAKETIQGLIGGLLQQIKIQLAIRDHALVRQTGRLLLYRPYFGEGRLSAGVLAELRNWDSLRSVGLDFQKHGRPFSWRFGPAIFVHDDEDLQLLEEPQRQKLKDRLKNWLAKKLSPEKFELFDFDHVSGPTANWFEQALRRDDQLLGGGILSPGEEDSLKDDFKKALEKLASEAQKIICVGAPTDDRDYVHYPRLGELTHFALPGLARTEILPKLFADIASPLGGQPKAAIRGHRKTGQ
jgi:hypothetical protein